MIDSSSSSDGSLTEAVATFALHMNFDSLTAGAVEDARRGLLDTLGVAIAGRNSLGAKLMLSASGAEHCSGTATIWGLNSPSSPTLAALSNGYAAHAMDYDDTQHDVGTHMSAPVLPSAMAAAEIAGRGGRDLLVAYTVGFEVGCRLGRAAGFARHLGRLGIHATGYLGHLGAAAAAGRLLDLDLNQMQHALGIAAGHASGLRASFGTMAKAQNAGNAAHNGILSALLAREGFTGPDHILDGDRNLFSASGGTTDAQALLDGLGTDFEIERNTLKLYACAGWRNPIVEATIDVATQHDLLPDQIERVLIWAWSDLRDYPNYKNPTTGLEGKFSAEHAAAIGLADRAGGEHQFSDERVNDKSVTNLRSHVELQFDEDLGPYQIRLQVQTVEGKEFSRFIPYQKGDHKNPFTWDELLVKFRANGSTTLPSDNIEAMIAMIEGIEDVGDIGDLTNCCRPGWPGAS
jgi:2-methylcitrate dehydratase PrpD